MEGGIGIRVSGVAKSYRRGGAPLPALAEVSFEVRPRTFTALLGPSGCGKSTLLNILAGLIAADRGEVLIGGRPLDRSRREIGLVFQDPNLFPWRTVFDNIRLPLQVMGRDTADQRARAGELLRVLGLAGFERSYPRELSGGMRQRVAVGRALVWEPPILLLDEPFGALDAITRERMGLWLLRLWEARKKTVVFVTHTISEAVFLADRVLIMSSRPGQITGDAAIDLPRSRTPELLEGAAFGALEAHLRRMLLAGAADE